MNTEMKAKIETRDVVVVGSGGAGLTTAVVAACEGLDVLLVEKADVFGGTTALSGGGIWVPQSSAAVKAGFDDSKEVAGAYVERVVGPTLEKEQLQAFLDAAPEMVDYLDAKTVVKFDLQPGFPDWSPDVEGAVEDGRLLSPREYDGKELGEYFLKLKAPLSEFNAPGGFMFGINDMPHLDNVTRSLTSFCHMAKLVGRFALDRLRYPRGTRLTMGNALAARLLRAAIDSGVELRSQTPVIELVKEGDRVTGVVVERDGQRITIMARKGVMLASGGFSADPQMRARFIPYPEHHISLVPETNTGDGIKMAMRAGAVMEQENVCNGAWTVMSLATDTDGSVIKFPHIFLDRSKPGCIAVNSKGERFADEATLDMVKDMHSSGSVPAHLVCDHAFIKKYGLGMVKPGGLGLKKWLSTGYILSAATLEELAAKIGCDPKGLVASAARMNEFAVSGVDADFAKGGNASDRSMGDPHHQPNPCLGPVKTAPFYAVKIYPGDSTTTLGLRVNERAQVVDSSGQPVAGLYAAGLDMNSLWRGAPPANGGNNTLSLTFGYIAARHMASQS